MTERTTIDGICQAVTNKAVLLAEEGTNAEYWFPLRYVRLVSGCVGRGAYAEISVPAWLMKEKRNEHPSPSVPAKTGDAIPADMLRRLIQLCHPDKHGGKASAQKATEWLLSQR